MASNITIKEDLHAEDVLENRLSPTECLCYIHKLICKLKFIYKKQNRSRFAQPYSLHLQCSLLNSGSVNSNKRLWSMLSPLYLHFILKPNSSLEHLIIRTNLVGPRKFELNRLRIQKDTLRYRQCDVIDDVIIPSISFIA